MSLVADYGSSDDDAASAEDDSRNERSTDRSFKCLIIDVGHAHFQGVMQNLTFCCCH